jgi:hypothetical protein
MGVTCDYLLKGYPYEWKAKNQKWFYFGNTQEEMEKSIMKYGTIEEQTEYKVEKISQGKIKKQLNIFDLIGA